MSKNEDSISGDLDTYSANVLINLGLINVAAIAAVITTKDPLSSYVPYAIGLSCSILAQLFWYAHSAFGLIFGDPIHKKNQRLSMLAGITILVLGTASAGCIVYGCLTLMTLSICLSIIISIILCVIPFFFLVIALRRENEARKKSQ